MIRTARSLGVFSATAFLVAFSGVLAAQTRTITLARTTPKGERVVAIAPTVGPGLPRPASPASQTSIGGRSALAATWQPMSVPPGIYLRAISMGTAQVGYAAGELGVVLKTIDGGSTWTTILNRGFPYY